MVLDVLYETPSLDNDGSYPEFFCSKDAFLRVEDIIESYLKGEIRSGDSAFKVLSSRHGNLKVKDFWRQFERYINQKFDLYISDYLVGNVSEQAFQNSCNHVWELRYKRIEYKNCIQTQPDLGDVLSAY